MQEEIFEKYPIPKAYFKLSLPVVFSMVISLVYNMVDTYLCACELLCIIPSIDFVACRWAVRLDCYGNRTLCRLWIAAASLLITCLLYTSRCV